MIPQGALADSVSCQYLAQDARRSYAHQRLIAAFVEERVLLIIHAQPTLDRVVEIGMAHAALRHSRITQFIGLPEIKPALHAPSGHPHVEAIGVVIAARRGILRFNRWKAAKLAGPHD